MPVVQLMYLECKALRCETSGFHVVGYNLRSFIPALEHSRAWLEGCGIVTGKYFQSSLCQDVISTYHPRVTKNIKNIRWGKELPIDKMLS